ncbi:ring-cleaving dioxygenase [Haloarcula pelagica]|uniref:ring-cleaving dioxygenase n=1 Tax=Haloarcula pelagica TaxID=3033389 RepID=UPI0024C43F53|nr:ring-cleaving dioxygenase [Halomicroarcula sp. YJ-61-S]
MPVTTGLHHVTAIAGDPQANADFYVGLLGLRFVKRTVNHDDTGTYHFYFGDYEGTPGTNVTFFPWTERGRRGEFGAGQTRAIAYRIPVAAVDYWVDRLETNGVAVERAERFGEPVLRFEDPDGIGLELVAAGGESPAVPWPDGPVPADRQLQGFHSVTLAVESLGPTADVLTDVLGFEEDGTEDGRHRYRSGPGGFAAVVDLVETDADRGRMGVGTVHHVAFRAESVAELREFRTAYHERDIRTSDIVDRSYFHALYAREPGGVLFELSTPEPGFTADEALADLGSSLVLPEWLEADREAIEAQLPAFDGPTVPGDG